MAWETFPDSYTSLQNQSWIFKTLWVIIFWVRVTCKKLNVNWEKIHSVILSVTCHGLRNFAPAHTHPLKTICEFSKPYELLFSELESCIKCNHKIRVQECYGGRAMFCPWHGGVEAYGGPLSVDMQPYGCFIFFVIRFVAHWQSLITILFIRHVRARVSG